MDFLEIQARLIAVLRSLHGSLPESELEDMTDLTAVGDPMVALENLCTQLVEYDVTIKETVRDEIECLGQVLDVRPDYWRGLAVSG
jgi:hypothetical protein